MKIRYLFLCIILVMGIALPEVSGAESCQSRLEQLSYGPVKTWLNAKKGYLVIVGTIVASSALSSAMTSHLPPHLQFIPQAIATLGIIVFGAPIWEPLQSWSRKVAFQVRDRQGVMDKLSQVRPLEGIWFNTQGNYSLNSQMSRNAINGFIASTRQNFYEAYGSMQRSDQAYAAAQVAEAAVRLHLLFRDIPPEEPSLVAAIHLAFTDHVQLDLQFEEKVWSFICRNDSQCRETGSQSHYQRILSAWL